MILIMLGKTNVDRREQRRLASRQEIIEAAWVVARDKGLGQLTLKDVADHVGMRPPSLYSHFASKNDIYDAMFGEAWGEFLAVVGEAQAHEPEEARAALRYYARLFFDYAVAFPARYQLMNLRTIPGFEPSEAAYAPSIAVLGLLTDRMASMGVSSQEDIDLYVALSGGLVDAQIANDPGGQRWARLLDRAVEMYADAVGIPATRSDR